jgi:hypothetical protein
LSTTTSRRFFRLYDDVYFPERWHLTGPFDAQGQEPEDFWQFSIGEPVKDLGPLSMRYDVPGQPLDYSHGGVDVPIVHDRVAEVFRKLAPGDVQLIPVQVEEQSDPYFILVVTRLIRCIDENASRILRWTPEDEEPEKVGQIRSVRELHLDKSRIGDAQIFRPEDWDVEIIVSEEIKEALERIQASGVTFTEVP